MKNFIIFGLLLSGILWNTTTLIAQSDRKISIQGILKDGDGAAVADGNYKLTFSLYTAAGTLKWTEDQPSVRVRGGVYSALLGTVKDFNTQGNTAIFDVPYFLGVKVNDGTELTPVQS